MPLEVFMDDIVQLRKSHPCGNDQWRVVRLGADIGLRCLGCDRKVLLPRSVLEKRLKRFVSRGPAAPVVETASPAVAPAGRKR